MLAPTSTLLWLTFWLAVPLLTLTGIQPAVWPFTALLLLALAALLTFDAYRVSSLLKLASVTTDSSVSAYKGRPATLSAAVDLPRDITQAQFALQLPATFETQQSVLSLNGATTAAFDFVPQLRGEFPIDIAYISARSPWRCWTLRAQRAISLRVQVFPDLSQDPASRRLFATFQQGQRVQRIVGRGREVERLREYAPGDSFDEVYWKATARRGAPVSKVFQVERTQDIYAIVDGSRLGNRNQALERFVSASLLLAIAAEKNSDNFGLLTFTTRVHDFVRASHGKGHFHRCRDAIFDLQPSTVSPDFAELFTFINLRIRKRALLFFLTDLSDPLLAETFSNDARFIARRHVTVVNQIADRADRPLFTGPQPASEPEVRDRLAGHLQWAKLRELEKALGHIGIRMHLLKPDRASSDLIGQYLDIKQRQLL